MSPSHSIYIRAVSSYRLSAALSKWFELVTIGAFGQDRATCTVYLFSAHTTIEEEIKCTVKLGDKECFDKEQIGVKEL